MGKLPDSFRLRRAGDRISKNISSSNPEQDSDCRNSELPGFTLPGSTTSYFPALFIRRDTK
jgi:hypothetical protein